MEFSIFLTVEQLITIKAQVLFLTNVTHFLVLPVTFTEYGQNVKQTRCRIDKAIFGKACGVYVTYVAVVDKDCDL